MATSASTSTSDRRSRNQTFKEEYKKAWDFIKPSKKGNNYAYCSICSADFSIAASGRYDIKKHIAIAKHRSSKQIAPSLNFYHLCRPTTMLLGQRHFGHSV